MELHDLSKPPRTLEQATLDHARAVFVEGEAYIVIDHWSIERDGQFFIPETPVNFFKREDIARFIHEGQYDNGPLMVLGLRHGRVSDQSESIAQDVLDAFISQGEWECSEPPQFCITHVPDAEAQVAEARQEAEEERKHVEAEIRELRR